MPDLADLHDALLAEFNALRPYGDAADPRSKDAAFDDNARLLAAALIVASGAIRAAVADALAVADVEDEIADDDEASA